MLNALINSYHTSFSIIVENGTITPPFYTFTASSTQFSPSPVTINGSATTNSTNLISSFPWLDTYSGAIRVTITVNGCSNVLSRMLFNVAGSTTTLANYQYIRWNGNNPGSTPHKAPTTSLPITTAMPTGSTVATYRANLDNALGWMGPSATLGLWDINTNGTYTLKVYQVDGTTGARYFDPGTSTFAPDLVDIVQTGSVSGGTFVFNGQTPTFDPLNGPFYATGSAASDAGYFKDFHDWAYSQGAPEQADFSSRVYRIDFNVVTPAPFSCSVTKTSYFKIAINTSITKNQSGNSKIVNNLDSASNNKLFIYPNPTSNQFEISIPFDWNEGDIVVTNSVGQAIIKQPIQPDKLSFDIKKLASGMYIYHITVDGVKYDGKLIKN